MEKYTLNFSPVTITGQTKVLVGQQPFQSERLDELRSEFSETHVFRRDAESDAIFDIPVAEGAQPLGNVQEEVDLAKQTRFLAPLLSDALIRTFHGSRDIITPAPVSVLGKQTKGIAIHADLPEWLQIRSLLKFHTRTIFTTDKPTFGIVCESRLKNMILGSCKELLELGVSPLNRYVQVEMPQRNPRIMSQRRLVGRVVAIHGETLTLEDHAEGYETIPVSDAYMEARRENFEYCVTAILGAKASSVLDNISRKAAIANSGPERKRQIEDAMGFLREKADLEAVPGATFSIEKPLSSNDRRFPRIENIPKPVLVFDPSATRKDDWAERGLKGNGPYDQRTFTPKQLRIAVICQAKFEGQVDSFVAKFLDGMPNVVLGRKSVARYGDGFLRRFRFEKPSVTFFTADDESAEAYVVASHHALEQAADEGFKWDLALVQVEEEFKSLNDRTNPYFATKSAFLKRDVPVQSVRLETMSQPDTQLVFSMNHMSLATYAKLGGVPWLLASGQTTAHELVIGLGSHSVSNSRIGASERYVGITTVFTSDGSYLLSDKTEVVPYEKYSDALYSTLKRSITAVREMDNWRNTDKVRLVFHMFKPPKDTEADAIKRTVEDLKLDNVTFAFLHIAPSHPYLIFDNLQPGIGYRDPKKGVLGPSRGLHLKLGDRESLIVFSGASELKQATDGMPRPCLLKLHRHSTFTDMTYLARQAFEFSGHSWRMLAPEPFPITIRYSDLISERLTGLNAISSWDPDAVRFGQIGRSLWFL